MRIAYVTYEMPGPTRFPGAATPERDGKVYIWTYNQNRFAVLDPKTAKVTEYSIPGVSQASNHSTRLAADGSVWFTEQAQNVIGKLDPATGEISTYTDNVPIEGTPWFLIRKVRSIQRASLCRNLIRRRSSS